MMERTSRQCDMATIQIISSDREKGEAICAALRATGHRPTAGPMTEQRRRELLDSPPDAVVLDLDRAPATCRDLGLFLRVQPITRGCLLVYLDGKPEKVDSVRALLPDACYTSSGNLITDLEHGLQNQPENPIVPDSVFAGYRGRPLSAKLGIKLGMVVALVNAPPGFEAMLDPLPDRTRLSRSNPTNPRLTLWFTTSLADLRAGLSQRLQDAEPGKIWIIWPKKASGFDTDLTQVIVRQAGLAANWVDFKVCSIDQTWTGLCFTARRKK